MTLPYTHSQAVWSAQAATATKSLDLVEFSRCPTKVIEVVTTDFTGTLDIQGAVGNGAAKSNVAYSLLGQDGAQAVTNDQLSYTTSTSVFRYLVTEPYPYMDLVMSRSAGSVTVNVFGWEVAVSPTAVIKLGANSGVDIGDVDVLSIAAGTNLIGKVGLDQTTPGTTNGVEETPVACSSSDVHAPAVNTAAVVTYAATASVKHVISGVAWSYVGGTPSGGNLKIEDVSGTTVFTMDIDSSGAGFIMFPKPKKAAAANTAMIITLAAAGAAVTGKVSVANHWTEA